MYNIYIKQHTHAYGINDVLFEWLSLSQPHSELVLIVEQRASLLGTGASPVFAIYSTMGIDHLWILHNSFVRCVMQEKTLMGSTQLWNKVCYETPQLSLCWLV